MTTVPLQSINDLPCVDDPRPIFEWAEGTTTLTSSGECSYDRTPEGLTADCRARGLTEVPNDLPENLVVLELKVNKIEILTNNSFSSVPILRYLSLLYNHLIYIQRGTFDSLSLLEYIDLSRNTNLPSGLPTVIFSKNPNLQVINLKSNNFTSIPIEPLALFRNVNKTTIRFAKNPIRHLNFSGFPLIHVFRLDLQSLSLSNLSFNDFLPLKRIPISILELVRNNLKVLYDGVFQYLRLVSKLYLSYNSIRNLTLNAFVGMESLTELYLSPDQLSGLNSLKYLDLSDNSMREFEEGVWDLPSLDTLDLSNFNIELLKTVSFKGLTNLRKLILSSNPIQNLGYDTFASIENLEDIDLSWLGQLSDFF